MVSSENATCAAVLLTALWSRPEGVEFPFGNRLYRGKDAPPDLSQSQRRRSLRGYHGFCHRLLAANLDVADLDRSKPSLRGFAAEVAKLIDGVFAANAACRSPGGWR